MKFGGASVATPDHFHRIADLITNRKNSYERVAVVVSAMGDTTNQLFDLAGQVHPNPPRREQDMLVSVGERISIALLAMALELKGIQAFSFTGSQSGIITTSKHSDARIIDVKPYRLLQHINQGQVVIVAGFQGVSKGKEITTLGRGGSDTSAVALGVALDAEEIQFFKDVPGVFESDPKLNPDALFLPELSYKKALELTQNGAKILHPRCIELAEKNAMTLHIMSFNSDSSYPGGSVIGKEGMKKNTPIYEKDDLSLVSNV